MKKKTYLEKLGLEPVEKLNVKICRSRVSHLKRLINAEELTGKLLKQARYYRSWYAWIAKNGGQRPKAHGTKKSA